MSKKLFWLLIAAVLITGISVGASIHNSQAPEPSRIQGGLLSDTFSYKRVSGANASSTYPVIVRGGTGVLGMVVIGQPASTTAIRIYDGMATSSTDKTATSSGTLIGTINATSTTGGYGPTTLIYGNDVRKGIVLDVPVGYGGEITIGYK